MKLRGKPLNPDLRQQLFIKLPPRRPGKAKERQAVDLQRNRICYAMLACPSFKACYIFVKYVKKTYIYESLYEEERFQVRPPSSEAQSLWAPAWTLAWTPAWALAWAPEGPFVAPFRKRSSKLSRLRPDRGGFGRTIQTAKPRPPVSRRTSWALPPRQSAARVPLPCHAGRST